MDSVLTSACMVQGVGRDAAETISTYVHMIMADKAYKEQEELQLERERKWAEVGQQAELSHKSRSLESAPGLDPSPVMPSTLSGQVA